jgi:type IV secretory pathway TrbD component
MTNPRLLPLLLLLGCILWLMMIFGLLYWVIGVMMLLVLAVVAGVIAYKHFR